MGSMSSQLIKRQAIVIAFFSSILIMTQTNKASGLTLQEAYRLALENYETVKIARESIIQAEMEKRKALSGLLPTIKSELDYTRRPEAVLNSSGNAVIRPQGDERFQLTLDQPLYTGGQATSAFKIAGLGIQGSREALGSTKEDLLFQVASIFYNTLKAKKNAQIDEDDVKRLEEHRRDAEARYRVGEVTKDVLLRAEAELSAAKASLIRADNDLKVAKDQLTLLTKLKGGFDADEPTAPVVPPQSDQEQLDTAYKLRHDLIKKRLDEQIALENVRFTRGSFFPFLSFEAQYIQDDQSPASPFSTVNHDKLAMLKLTLPLFEGGFRIADLREAQSKARQAELDHVLLREQIRLDIHQSNFNLQALNSVLENLRDQLAFSEENYALVSKRFQFGLATNIDVLDANNTLLDAERQLANSSYDRDLAVLSLQKGMGVFLQYAGVE
jgi:outer membrane protein